MNQIIIYHDGGSQEITETQSTEISQATIKGEKIVFINNKPVALSAIARVVSTEEYYRQFPDKRPAEKLPEFKMLRNDSYKSVMNPEFFNKKQAKHLKQKINGLKNYIKSDKYQGSAETKELLTRMETKLASLAPKELLKQMEDKLTKLQPKDITQIPTSEVPLEEIPF